MAEFLIESFHNSIHENSFVSDELVQFKTKTTLWETSLYEGKVEQTLREILCIAVKKD